MKSYFKWPQIAAFRLTRHHFNQGQADLTIICRNVCGIQAQLMAAAEMALWARKLGLTRTDIHAALWESRTLVKTSCMRQTLHLIPAADFFIYINALKRSRVEAFMRIMSKFGVTPKEVGRMNEMIVEALRDGSMTQRELTEQILPKAGKKLRAYMDLAWSIQLFRLALVEGLICYGVERNKKAAFVQVDHWLPKQKAIEAKTAQQILLRRYLHAYGPATLQDFSRWSGILMQEAKPIWEALQDDLVEISIEGKRAFILRDDYGELADSELDGQRLRLLPHFDPYMLGHVDKDHLVDPDYYKRVYRNQGWISPVILLNGRVIGAWS
jgi:hypothetical protein